MNFARKTFLGIFISTLVVGSALIWVAHYIVSSQTTSNYASRYISMSRLLGASLYEMERNTETLMLDAARVVTERERQFGLQSTADLKRMASQLGVTHLFEINSSGNFIRSTNEAPELIPNVYSFCSEYREFLKGAEEFRKTPIIPPSPEPLPYKFLFVHNALRNRFIEVGVRVDFLGNRLTEALKTDPSVLAINLFTPDGTSLGEFSRDGSRYSRSKVELPKELPATFDDGNRLRIFERVDSGQTSCCQCDTAGISKDGQYYYIFESVVSKAALAYTLTTINRAFAVLQILACFIAWLVAYFISGHLTSRVRAVASRVRSLGEQEDSSHKIGIQGGDEIAYLAQEFDALLERQEASQQALLRVEKAEALARLASQVAHDIRSPLAALGVLEPNLKELPEEERIMARMAIGRIRDIANNLLGQQRATQKQDLQPTLEHIQSALETVVSEKRLQYQDRNAVLVELLCDHECYDLFSRIHLTEFKRVISNLIDNGVEALIGEGRVAVRVSPKGNRVVVQVQDTGKGISVEVLANLAGSGGSFGKSTGSGLGLSDAKRAVESWNGILTIESQPSKGTCVALSLPQEQPPTWFASEIRLAANRRIVCLDDDPLIHEVWRERLGSHARLTTMKLASFQDAETFIRSCSNKGFENGALYLVDFELSDCERDGLDVIEEMNIEARSVLVTSRFEEESIRQRCKEMGVRILPKTMAKWVPISADAI